MDFKEFTYRYGLSLNDKQTEAVKAVDGPVLLLAVPGSGKTTVLVSRIGYMIYCMNIPAKNILTVTYTKAAASDMKKRFISIFGREHADDIEFRTINGICFKIIQYYCRLKGSKGFTLVESEGDTNRIISSIYSSVEKEYPAESDLKSIRTDIAYIKNMMLTEEEIKAMDDDRDYCISKIYSGYSSVMRERRLMDYDDQMVYTLRILRNHPEILKVFQKTFSYICVDEAQDTSKIQHVIIAMLAAGKDNLFMVGDEDQSIYGFRAAYPQALLDFGESHRNAKIISMEINYRSDENIVKAADRFIRINKNRYEKNMTSAKPAIKNIRYIDVERRQMQYDYLLKVADGCTEETACLYRNNESAVPVVDLLERNGIPYRIKGDELAFFRHKSVRDIRSIALFSSDQKNAELFMTIYYKIKTYLSKEKAEEACSKAAKYNVDILYAAIRYCNLSQKTKTNCEKIYDALKKISTERAVTALDRICNQMGYNNYLSRNKHKDTKITILKSLAVHEDSITGLAGRLDELEEIIRSKKNDKNCRFILSTIHASKGLEYDRVYLIDVADGIFPELLPDSPDDRAFEEERRIFYVGMTRAKKELDIFCLPEKSVFIEQVRSIDKDAPSVTGKQPSKKYEADFDFVTGLIVEHVLWGEGVVLDVTDSRVIIEFANGVKTLSIKTVKANGLVRPAAYI